jgi:3-oxoacyl-[acyl-carrier-protein] synthase II
LRRKDPDLGAAADFFTLGTAPVPGNDDGGVLTATQGFGGYDGALALRAANPTTLRRYRFSDPRILDAYLERWAQVRQERIEREARWRRTTGFARLLAEQHRWLGGEG